jgi:hypothetical protein
VHDVAGSRIRIDHIRVRLDGMPAESARLIASDLGWSLVDRLGPVVAAAAPVRATVRSIEPQTVRPAGRDVAAVRAAVAETIADQISTRLPARRRVDR